MLALALRGVSNSKENDEHLLFTSAESNIENP
jgi:hypothetical protein